MDMESINAEDFDFSRILELAEDHYNARSASSSGLRSVLCKTKRWFKGLGLRDRLNLPGSSHQSQLHGAVINGLPKDVLKLLQEGADVNSADKHKRTPLYYAIRPNNLEVVCMLLYYGADIMIKDSENDTPFSYAYHNFNGLHNIMANNIEQIHCVVEVLIDYFDDTFLKSCEGIKAFFAAAEYGSPLAIDLIKAGAEVSSDIFNIDQYYPQSTALYYAMKYNSAQLFKLVMPKVDLDSLIIRLTGVHSQPEYRNDPFFYLDITPTPFLIYYLKDSCFVAQEWIDCLYLILECPVVPNLIENCLDYRPLHRRPNEHYFLQEVFEAFHRKEVLQLDRIDIIYTILSFGADVNYFEFNSAFQLYGFGDELDALIYSVKSYNIINKSKEKFLLLPMYILGCEFAFDKSYVFQLYEREATLNAKKHSKQYFSWYPMDDFDRAQEHNYFMNSLGYFAISENTNLKLRELVQAHLPRSEEICERLGSIPAVPSLTEVSRDSFRRYLQRMYQFKYPYQLHDCIKRMNIPEVIKEVLRFKRCILAALCVASQDVFIEWRKRFQQWYCKFCNYLYRCCFNVAPLHWAFISRIVGQPHGRVL